MTFEVRSSAGRLEAALFLPETEPRLAVVLCHGLPSGSPKDPDDPGYPGLARELAGRGIAAATFSFRGCYGSDGDLSFAGWIDDVRAVVDAMGTRTRAPVALAGSSLGGAAAIVEAAGDPRVRAVATLAAPAALDDLAANGVQFLESCRAIGLLRSPGYPSDVDSWANEFATLAPERAAARLGSRPILVVHGDADEVVPPVHAARLRNAASGPVTSVLLAKAGHQLRRDAIAVRVLFAWLGVQLR
jgi:alpha-beta hydrolase superfamily lysophospholipase